MAKVYPSIPRPLVRTNQVIIVSSVVLFWLFSQPLFLLIPIIPGLSGQLLHFNPVFIVAKKFLRKPLSTYAQEDKADQRFNQWIALTLLSITFVSSLLDYWLVAYVSSALVLTAASIAIAGFCIGCFIRYQYLRYRNQKKATR